MVMPFWLLCAVWVFIFSAAVQSLDYYIRRPQKLPKESQEERIAREEAEANRLYNEAAGTNEFPTEQSTLLEEIKKLSEPTPFLLLAQEPRAFVAAMKTPTMEIRVNKTGQLVTDPNMHPNQILLLPTSYYSNAWDEDDFDEDEWEDDEFEEDDDFDEEDWDEWCDDDENI
jgi:hypothetical protein